MIIFLDTNILFELIEDREQSNYVYRILDELSGNAEFYISVGCFYTLTYVVDKHMRQEGIFNPERTLAVKKVLRFILKTCRIANLDWDGLSCAIESDDFQDLEDSYQYQAALSCQADILLTINIKDFLGIKDHIVTVLTPKEFVKTLPSTDGV